MLSSLIIPRSSFCPPKPGVCCQTRQIHRAPCTISTHFTKNQEDIPWIVVGFGNPGKKFNGTRHNVGFEMIDRVSKTEGIEVNTLQARSLIGLGSIGGRPVLLAKAQTYMADIGEYSKFPLKLLEKTKNYFKKEPTLEDELRKRIEQTKSETGGGGDGPRSPPSGGDDDDSEEDEDEDEEYPSWDETFQVLFATFGLIFVYMYIIKGTEMTMTAKDCIARYIFKGPRTARVANVEFIWEAIVQSIRGNTEVENEDPNELLRAIVHTPTWWDNDPEKYKEYLQGDHKPLKFSDFYSDSDTDYDSDLDKPF